MESHFNTPVSSIGIMSDKNNRKFSDLNGIISPGWDECISFWVLSDN